MEMWEEFGEGKGNIGDADAAPILVKTDYGGLEEKGGGVVYTSLGHVVCSVAGCYIRGI